MNEYLRERILRKLETLSDERGYQLLDYAEFLESKYAEKMAATPNVFQRFSEAVEDGLRAGRVSASTISEAMGLMNRAMNVLGGVAAAGKSVASDLVSAATKPTGRATSDTAPSPAPPAAPSPPPAEPSPQPPGEQLS
jgi:hypothetical protein